MFSSALKSFTSNITSAYTISPQPHSTSGPWKIFSAKRKTTSKAASIFVFDRKTLDPPTSSGLGSSRSTSQTLKRAHEEVIERLKKEASSLARLRHPCILELVEPVEETRNGGLMFATEPVMACLGSLLAEMDEKERAGGGSGKSGRRYVVDDSNESRELEIDELEIQKGLLQLGKGLEFLHESAGLVHANLTPEAVLVNAKGDWKISGLSFCGPHESSTTPTSLTPISLSEVLNHDPRLPSSVQLNLDFTSPDFILDNTLAPSADIFSLGLLIISLYNSPHTSPLSAGGSLSTYKRLFASSSTIPTQQNNFLVPSSTATPLPANLKSDLLPRLITRRPAQRVSAREFQEAKFFDNILVSTIRFLDALPAKTANEKAAFLKGLPKILPQFPKSVLEKKVLPALLEEMKDRDLLAPVLSDIFAAVKIMPAASGKRVFTEMVVPKLREVFLPHHSSKDKAAAAAAETDKSKEAGLMILLENMSTAASNCQGKEFREDILPIIILALESPTHALVDAALSTLKDILTVLDFSTIKNELFPVIAAVFAKTSSLNIKIRGLEAFCVLCGGSTSDSNGVSGDVDDLNGFGTAEAKHTTSSSASSAILDKHTIQTQIVPLLKGIKTKEPGVMMAALHVFKQVGEVADSDFLAMEVLPVLWSFSLGPLLNLQQFQSFMGLIKGLGGRIEREQTKKLRELRGGEGSAVSSSSIGGGRREVSGLNSLANGGEEADFESLVSGRKAGGEDLMNDWAVPKPATQRSQSAQNTNTTNDLTFSWQTTPQPATRQPQAMSTLRAQTPAARAITPDQPLSAFSVLTPGSTQFSQPLQAQSANSIPLRPAAQQPQQQAPSVDWSAATRSSANAWSVPQSQANGFGAAARPTQSSFTLSPPPSSPQQVVGGGGFKPPPPPAKGGGGLDKYESLL